MEAKAFNYDLFERFSEILLLWSQEKFMPKVQRLTEKVQINLSKEV